MNKKKIFILIAIVLILVLIFAIAFFIKNNYKNFKIGNTNINKNIKEIEEYILNISSYSAKISVEVQSNKNKNKYMISQQYIAPNIEKQVVEEPSNIAGLETIYDGKDLKINNTKLNLNTIYENYQYITNNYLWLNSFIEDYKNGIETGKNDLKEEKDAVIMETKNLDEGNRYICYKRLYIDKKTCKPVKMLVQDINQKTIAYIQYIEIDINGLKENEVLAFKAKTIAKQI